MRRADYTRQDKKGGQGDNRGNRPGDRGGRRCSFFLFCVHVHSLPPCRFFLRAAELVAVGVGVLTGGLHRCRRENRVGDTRSCGEVSERVRYVRHSSDGVVWCGVVWCGVVWCGVLCCAVLWCGVVWCVWVQSGVRCAAPLRVSAGGRVGRGLGAVRGHHAARDHARRHGARGTPRRREIQGPALPLPLSPLSLSPYILYIYMYIQIF